MCGLLVVVVAFVCFELCCVMLCAPALSLAFLSTSLYVFPFLKRVAVYFLLSCVTEMFLVPLFGVFVVFSGCVMFCCKRMLCKDRLVLP